MVVAFRGLATTQGRLAPDAPLPDDATLSAAIDQAGRARSTISTVEPYRAQVERWAAQGVGGIAIHAALCRDHGYRGSYSAVRRVLAGIRASLPPEATVRIAFLRRRRHMWISAPVPCWLRWPGSNGHCRLEDSQSIGRYLQTQQVSDVQGENVASACCRTPRCIGV